MEVKLKGLEKHSPLVQCYDEKRPTLTSSSIFDDFRSLIHFNIDCIGKLRHLSRVISMTGRKSWLISYNVEKNYRSPTPFINFQITRSYNFLFLLYLWSENYWKQSQQWLSPAPLICSALHLMVTPNVQTHVSTEQIDSIEKIYIYTTGQKF